VLLLIYAAHSKDMMQFRCQQLRTALLATVE